MLLPRVTLVFSDLLVSLRFERELEALRKEIAESSARASSTSGSSTPGTLSRGSSSTDLSNMHTRTDSSDSLHIDETIAQDPVLEKSSPVESKKDL